MVVNGIEWVFVHLHFLSSALWFVNLKKFPFNDGSMYVCHSPSRFRNSKSIGSDFRFKVLSSRHISLSLLLNTIHKCIPHDMWQSHFAFYTFNYQHIQMAYEIWKYHKMQCAVFSPHHIPLCSSISWEFFLCSTFIRSMRSVPINHIIFGMKRILHCHMM